MKLRNSVFTVGLAAALLLAFQTWRPTPAFAQANLGWPQWGRTPQHTGTSRVAGQSPDVQLADITFDPFVAQEQAESGGELLAHYQAPLVDGNNVFVEYKTGVYVSCQPPGSGGPAPCGPNDWATQIWNERAFTWQNGALVEQWNFESDWKPEPNGGVASSLQGWEPVFHAAVSNGYVYVPGFSGSIYKLNESDGSVAAHFIPFGTHPNVYVSGPLTIDRQGNVYYNTVALNTNAPWSKDVAGAWLVKITAGGSVHTASYGTLIPGAPSQCDGTSACGSQRPGVNVAPAVSADGGTVYIASRAHFFADTAYLVAVNSNLTPQWQTSLRGLLGASRNGEVVDQASSSPTVTPDGAILFGVLTNTSDRGELMKFSSSGQFLTAYDFGWDETPAIYPHDGTYSVIIKDNHYDTGGPYYITQLDSNLKIQWQFKNTTVDSRHRNGYEWCVNAPAVDRTGTVYANSEDGNVYVINPDGTLEGQLFLRLAIGAAYTPIAIGADGQIYTENDGDMFAIGQAAPGEF